MTISNHLFSQGYLKFICLLGSSCFLLSGCFSDNSDLHDWMAEQKSTIRPTIKPIPEPKRFVPQVYENTGAVDPFSSERLTQALKQMAKLSGASDALLSPELNRRKEALEAFPLDSMAMTGSILKDGKLTAILRVDKLLYSVKVGDYIGQNYGRIMKITEGGLLLREIVQDSTGEWTERMTQLELKENLK